MLGRLQNPEKEFFMTGTVKQWQSMCTWPISNSVEQTNKHRILVGRSLDRLRVVTPMMILRVRCLNGSIKG